MTCINPPQEIRRIMLRQMVPSTPTLKGTMVHRSADEIATFTAEATSGGYNDLLVTVMRWVDCT